MYVILRYQIGVYRLPIVYQLNPRIKNDLKKDDVIKRSLY